MTDDMSTFLALARDDVRRALDEAEVLRATAARSQHQEAADARAAHGPCAHCGRQPAAGYAMAQDVQLCHPDDPSLPDCYRRVTVYHEPVGALIGAESKPAGVESR